MRNQVTPSGSSRYEAVTFILRVVGATCILGIAVDCVTANIAVEYFSVHHPHVVDSTSPWVLALVWGIGASWWFGLIAAVVLWWVNARRSQPLPQRRVFRMVARSLVLVWLIMMAIVGGVYGLAGLVPETARRGTFEADRRLMAVAISHASEYVLGGLLTVALSFRIAKSRTD